MAEETAEKEKEKREKRKRKSCDKIEGDAKKVSQVGGGYTAIIT